MNNRLKLDWTIQSSDDRKLFIDTYLTQIKFTPTPEELETLSNYILWGKDVDGKSSVQRHEIEIEPHNKTWQKKEDESLDSLIESPAFNESILTTPKIKQTRTVFSRDEALNESPNYLKKIFSELFNQIDTIDLIINYYDLQHGKRKKPPRDNLLQKFSPTQQELLYKKAEKLNQFKYLKLRHQLVELRRQQFTLRDSYRPQLQRNTIDSSPTQNFPLIWEDNCQVYPLGVISSNKLGRIFLPEDQLNPSSFTEEDLKIISRFYWRKKEEKRQKLYIDFTNELHLISIFHLYFELQDSKIEEDYDSMTARLLRTLQFYISLAHLSPIQKEILNFKIQKYTNQQIASYINKKYSKHYTTNYISTIFRQKIIPNIIDAVYYHLEIIGNLFFKENFKKCTRCGRTLLVDSYNFTRKKRSKDGFSTRCKRCEKEIRRQKQNQR